MAGKQRDARGWIFQIQAADGSTWVDIEGLTEFEIDRGESEEEAETTTFEDAGQARSQPMQRGATCKLTARDLAKPLAADKGAQVIGQARVDQLGDLVGDAAMSTFRFRHVTQTLTWEQWPVWVSRGGAKGEFNDKTEWSATMHRDGAATYPTYTP